MYWLDVTFLALIGLGAILGAVSGLLWQVARIVGLGVAVVAALYFNADAMQWLQANALHNYDPRFLRAAAYVAVFVGIYVAIFVVTLLLEKALRAARLKPLDRLAGAGLGALKAALILGALCLGAASLHHAGTAEILAQSTLAPRFAEGMHALLAAIPPQYTDELRLGLHNLKESIRTRTTQAPETTGPRPPEAGGANH
jgi:uncharacterized membrane protein required for colicin V production